MSISKLRNLGAVEKTNSIPGIEKTLALSLGVEHGDLDKSSKEAGLKHLMTAEGVGSYLRGIAENSQDEIDALMSDLRGLREKLTSDGNRIQQEIVEYAKLNQAVLKLTEVVSNGVAQVKTPYPTE